MSRKVSLSRSQRVRQRRQERPRVVQRAGWVDDFAHPRREGYGGKRSSRVQRYEVAVGSFVRAPRRLALPRFSLPRLGLLSMLLLGAALLYLLLGTPYFRVTRPQIQGTRWVKPAEVEAELRVDGRLIFSLLPSRLEEQLRRAFPEFASVTVRWGWPNQLLVQVVERQPLIRWEMDGRYTWIDAQGVALRPRGEAPQLLRVQALTPPPPQPPPPDALTPPAYISPQMVEAVRRLAVFLPPGTSILYDARHGFGWDDGRGGRVFFGETPEEMPQRAQVYLYLRRYLEQRGIYPVMIDLTYPDAPYYRLEP